MDLHGKRIILGSGSPRRRELLSSMGIDFTVDAETSFIESFDPATPHAEIPLRLAEGKSRGFHRALAEDEILITSDTLVLCDDAILGKPRDREDAIRMLRLLSGRRHEVITGVCLRDRRRVLTAADTAEVWFKDLTDAEIIHYVDQYQPLDKAGAYGIQEWIGYIGIPRIAGSFYTIMGFPTHLVYDLLCRFL